jgi:hypothetical protein
MSGYDAVDGARSAASKCYRLVASKPGSEVKEPRKFRREAGGRDIRVSRFINDAIKYQYAAGSTYRGLMSANLITLAHFTV